MNLLVAVKSCEYDRQRGAHQLVRDIWGDYITVNFFMGNGGNVSELDEIVVDAPDGYPGLPFKTREIARYALLKYYDYVFFCDTGSFLIPHHLLDYDFKDYDYVGYWAMLMKTFPYTAQDTDRGCPPVYIERCHPWASGGGYVLSRRALLYVANAEPDVHAEDLWVGQVLGRQGIKLHDAAQEGWKGFVADWIHLENNMTPNSLALRRLWMEDKKRNAERRCSTGCYGPAWKPPVIELMDPEVPNEVEQILAARRAARRKK